MTTNVHECLSMRLGVDEAAQLLGVSTKTIYRWVNAGKIPGYRVQKQYRFDRWELLEWATAHRLTSAPVAPPPEPDQPLPRFDQALEAGGVHYRVGGQRRDDALKQAVLAMRLVGEADRDHLTEALVHREALASTAVGDGFALPHPRNPLRFEIDRPTVSVCFLDHPVDWGAPDGEPVTTLLVVMGPTVRSVLRLHLETWFALRDPGLRSALRGSATRDVLFAEARRVATTLHRPPGETA